MQNKIADGISFELQNASFFSKDNRLAKSIIFAYSPLPDDEKMKLAVAMGLDGSPDLRQMMAGMHTVNDGPVNVYAANAISMLIRASREQAALGIWQYLTRYAPDTSSESLRILENVWHQKPIANYFDAFTWTVESDIYDKLPHQWWVKSNTGQHGQKRSHCIACSSEIEAREVETSVNASGHSYVKVVNEKPDPTDFSKRPWQIAHARDYSIQHKAREILVESAGNIYMKFCRTAKDGNRRSLFLFAVLAAPEPGVVADLTDMLYAINPDSEDFHKWKFGRSRQVGLIARREFRGDLNDAVANGLDYISDVCSDLFGIQTDFHVHIIA